MEGRIERVNRLLEEIGSVFRVDEDLTMLGYFGNLTFLRRQFSTVEELENYVTGCVKNYKREAL